MGIDGEREGCKASKPRDRAAQLLGIGRAQSASLIVGQPQGLQACHRAGVPHHRREAGDIEREAITSVCDGDRDAQQIAMEQLARGAVLHSERQLGTVDNVGLQLIRQEDQLGPQVVCAGIRLARPFKQRRGEHCGSLLDARAHEVSDLHDGDVLDEGNGRAD